MLSREDRILTELLASRGLVVDHVLEQRTRQQAGAGRAASLAELLVDSGDLDRETAREVVDEARELDRLMEPETSPRERLGAFRLVREIGRGGMGVVYEAVQEPLERRVAVKVLPPAAALNERLTIRFLREARATARLHHPGIVPVFAAGHDDGVLYFAMEYVEGQSLSALCDGQRLDPHRAARIAAQVARGLDHAHRCGLIHRDVKPENVLVEAGDKARIADFGLVYEGGADSLTLPQHVLGTPAYIAPEQARGRGNDARADIYGLGAVLYAMLAGRPPYEGDVPAVVLGHLLTEPPPPLDEVAPGVPQQLVTTCERAMAREPEDRHADAGELADQLERYLSSSSAAVPAQPERSRERSVVPARRRAAGISVAAIATIVLAALAVGIWRNRSGTENSPPTPPSAIVQGALVEANTMPGNKRALSVSADGRTLAFSSDESGEWTLYLQRPGEDPTRVRPYKSSDPVVSFDPAGDRFAIGVQGSLRIRNLDNSNLDSFDGLIGLFPRWSPDGREIAFLDRGMAYSARLWSLDLATRQPRLLTSMSVWQPSWSPASSRLVFASHTGGLADLWTIGRQGGAAIRLTNDAAVESWPQWLSPGRLLYCRTDLDGSDLWELPVDEATGEAIGKAVPLTRGVLAFPPTLASAPDVRRLALTFNGSQSTVLALPFDPRRGVVTGPPTNVHEPLPISIDRVDASPSGSWLAAVGPPGKRSLRLLSASGEAATTLTDAGSDDSPRWSPDGRQVAFHADRSGSGEIWVLDAETHQVQRLTETRGDARDPVWSPDATRIAFTIVGDGAYTIDLAGSKPTVPTKLRLPTDRESFSPWSWSADGTRLAGSAGGIAVYSFRDEDLVVLTERGERPIWSTDLDHLLHVRDDRVWRVDVRTGEEQVVYSHPLHRLGETVSRSAAGDELYVALHAVRDTVWWFEPEPHGSR